MPVQVDLFGPPAVTVEGRREPVPPVKPAALLLYLAYAGRWVSRDELVTVLRSEEDEPASRLSLRLLLTRARRWAWAAGVEAEPQRLRWPVATDVAGVRAALAAREWRRVAGRLPAPLLQGWPTQGLPGVQEWLEVERGAWRALWLDAALRHEEELVGRGAHDEAARLLGRALEADPLSEEVLQRFLRACLAAGRRGDGLRAFERFAARLGAELGLRPLPGTQALADALRAETPARQPLLSPPTPPPPVPVLGLPSLRRPPPLVGRDTALAALRGAVTPVVLVAGEPGLGKTRLLAEALPGARPVRCQEGLEHVPYAPLLAALRSRWPGVPDPGPYRADLARFLPDLWPDPQPEPPVDGAGPDASSAPEDAPESGKARLLEAFARVLAADDALVVDDLQWADPATLEWLTYLVGRGGVRLRGAYRDGEVGPALEGQLRAWRAQTTLITLAPLGEAEVAALVGEVTRLPESGDDLARWLHLRGGGNPLVTLEWLRTLLESGAYEVGDGTWRPGRRPLPEFDDLAPPPRLADLVLRRAQALAPFERRVLDLASVLGGTLDSRHLARALGEDEWAVGDALARAERLGLLRGTRFAHDLVRRALFGALPETRRRLLHGRVAEALTGVLDDLVVAEHAWQAGDEEGAARRWVGAAQHAFGTRPGFEDEATRLYERVLGLGVRSPEWYRAGAALAVRRRVSGRADEARDLIALVLRESGDPEARAVAHAEGATLAYMDGDLAAAAALVGLAAQEAQEARDPELRRSVLLMQVNIAHHRGEYGEALRTAQEVVAQLRREALSHSFCNWLSLLGALLCDVGRFEEALALYREQLGAARFLRLRAEQVKASSDIIATLHDLGRIQEGVALAEEALDLGHFNDTYPLRYHLALAYGRSGRLAEALDHAGAVVRGSASVNMRAHAYALLAELHAGAGAAEEAGAALRQGLGEVEGCDILTARAVLVIAVVEFGPDALVDRARPILAELREDALPAYLRADFRRVLAARPRAQAGPMA